MMKVGILGLGWLGEELYKKLESSGFSVKGTVSSEEKARTLSEKKMNVLAYQLGEDVALLNDWCEMDCIIVTIPPSSIEEYSTEAKRLFRFFGKGNKAPVFIYTGSTSVYGNEAREVDETSTVKPVSENARKIVEVEEFLFNQYGDHSIILRMAGLVGGDRHPVHYLSGKNNIAKPLAPVNLVHREDVIESILFLLQNNYSSGIFNLSCSEHPGKKEFYTKVAEQKKIALPQFDESDKLKDKTVICKTIKSAGYTFKYISPYNFPNED